DLTIYIFCIVSASKNVWLAKIDDIVEGGVANNTAEDKNDNGINQNENLSTNVSDDNFMLDQIIKTDHVPFENFLDATDEDEDPTVVESKAYHQKSFESVLNDSDSDSNEKYDSDQRCTSTSQDPHYYHVYDVVRSSDEIIAYIAGYMVRKISRYTKCFTCINTLQSTNKAESGRDKFIELMSDVVGTQTIKCNTIHQILDKISLRESLPRLGCIEHRKELM
ncbi:hypothetical protein PV327_011683, partial [Microctonus hyperodae]